MATERREGTNEVTRTVRPDLAAEDVRKGRGEKVNSWRIRGKDTYHGQNVYLTYVYTIVVLYTR